MTKRKTRQSKPVAAAVFVPVDVIMGETVCRVELSPATVRRYERAARRCGVSVADLLRDIVTSFLADRYRLN